MRHRTLAVKSGRPATWPMTLTCPCVTKRTRTPETGAEAPLLPCCRRAIVWSAHASPMNLLSSSICPGTLTDSECEPLRHEEHTVCTSCFQYKRSIANSIQQQLLALWRQQRLSIHQHSRSEGENWSWRAESIYNILPSRACILLASYALKGNTKV